MTAPKLAPLPKAGSTPEWPSPRQSRVPAWIFTDEALYRRELDIFHYGRSWNYVGMECEVAEPGDFRRSWIGEKPVVVARDLDGMVHVVENRCAHRGAPVCWQDAGKALEFICPYHNWSYALSGELRGVPFERGVRGVGGMPKGFDKSSHGLRRLKVVSRGGAVWASFHDDPPDFESFVGPRILAAMDRLTDGRTFEFLGSTRQVIDCNWKLWIDNARDTYHATLLHTFLTKFRITRADLPLAEFRSCGLHTHNTAYLEPVSQGDAQDATRQIRVMSSEVELLDSETISKEYDEFGDKKNMGFQVFPTGMHRQHLSAPSYRQIIPRGPQKTEIVWSFYGYVEDNEQLRRRRLKQANLVGAAGFVTAEDGEILPPTQANAAMEPGFAQVLDLGGESIEDPDGIVFENLIRAMYDNYRAAMGL